jgi:hypothetical protein
MKLVFATFILLAGISSHASNITFLPTSILPTELKVKISAALTEQCHSVLNAQEIDSLPTKVSLDNGSNDTYYNTNFKAFWYFDGSHPLYVTIVVKSAELSISNPSSDRYPIIEISSADGACGK